MANKTQRITAAAVLGILLVTGRQATAREQPLTLTVKVDTADTDVTREELAEATSQTTKVYEAIGVNLRWVFDGQDAEGLDSGTYTVRLVLLSGAKARRVIKLEHLEEGVFGYATAGLHTAYIFCNRVITSAGLYKKDYAKVLGYVIAHELGHLVLPPHSHSSTGIMRANIYLRAPRLAYFTETQGTFIRNFLMAVSRAGEIKIAKR